MKKLCIRRHNALMLFEQKQGHNFLAKVMKSKKELLMTRRNLLAVLAAAAALAGKTLAQTTTASPQKA
jgi:hypothetical protein